MDFQRLPYKDETQYASDMLSGKRKIDVIIIVVATLVGAALGVAIGFAGADANNEAPKAEFILGCAAIIAFAFAVITGLMLASLRTIIAICKAWVPARFIVGAVCVLEVLNIGEKAMIWMLDPSRILMDSAMGLMLLAFGILFLTLGLRLVFWIYCAATGKDDEEITAREIAAKDGKRF